MAECLSQKQFGLQTCNTLNGIGKINKQKLLQFASRYVSCGLFPYNIHLNASSKMRQYVESKKREK